MTAGALSPPEQFLHLSTMARPMWRIAVVALCLWPIGAAAQEPLTLEQAIADAIARNASIRAARAAGDEARAGRAQARAAWFPTVTFSESWQRGNQPVFVFGSLLAARRFAAANFALDALNHPDPIGFFQTTVAVEQSLFDGGRRRAAARLADAGADSLSAEVDATAARVVAATAHAFGRLIATRASQRAAAAALDAAREDHARAIRRRDAGMLTDADVLALAVHVADLDRRVIQSRGDAASAEADLNYLTGAPIDRHVVAAEPRGNGAVSPAADLPSLMTAAETSRPELARAAAAERAAQARQRQARSALIPEIAAQAAVNVSGTKIADRASSWVAGGELRWTLSVGGAQLAAMRAATAATARARAEAEDARAAVQVDVAQAFHQLETAKARRAAGAAAVEEARESQRIIRDRFEAGLAPVNDVLRASTAVLDADANRIAALVDVVTADVNLRRAVGRIR